MPVPESERESAPVRIRRASLPDLDRIAKCLRERAGGGQFSRADAVAIAATEWLDRHDARHRYL